ncbi:MAG: hypothetical protein JO281_08245 [Pseudonocardiales bacterium]|nr:hypothetical protein [Pseudonocardiales bacterium]
MTGPQPTGPHRADPGARRTRLEHAHEQQPPQVGNRERSATVDKFLMFMVPDR